jgi:hypothetical protein
MSAQTERLTAMHAVIGCNADCNGNRASLASLKAVRTALLDTRMSAFAIPYLGQVNSIGGEYVEEMAILESRLLDHPDVAAMNLGAIQALYADLTSVGPVTPRSLARLTEMAGGSLS